MLLFFTDAERPGFNTPMRRSRRQSCQKHGGRLDPASFGRAAAVVRNGGRVPDQVDLKPRSLKGADGGLAARPRPLHDDVDLTHAVILSSLGHLLRRDLRREWGGLAGPLEPHVAPAGPGEDVAAPVADAENRIVEGGVAFLIGLPAQSNRALTFPHAEPKRTMSPRCSVPCCTMTVATGPLPLSSWASTTTPEGDAPGFPFSSCISATRSTISRSWGMPAVDRKSVV